MSFRKTILAAAICGAMLPGVGTAAITVDGITFSPGAIFSTATLWEGNCTTGAAIASVGDQLCIFGRVNNITDAVTSQVLWQASAGRELTFVGSGFTALTAPPGSVNFSGGSITMYSDSTPDSVVNGPAGTTGFTDGSVFLTFAPQTLYGSGLVTLNSLVFPSFPVTGVGLLDVTGGSAAANFDTNYYNATTLPATHGALYGGVLTAGDVADVFFTSQGSLSNSAGWAFDGSGNLYARAQAVPEPGTLALLGLGLAGFGCLMRRKS